MRAKSTALGIAAAAAFSGAAISGALAAACTTAPLSTYISGVNSTCTVGDKTFSNFHYTPAGAVKGVVAANVSVTPVTGPPPPGVPGPGLTFNANWSIGTKSTTGDFLLNFKVALTANAVKAGTLIDDAYLHFVGSETASANIKDSETITHNGVLLNQVLDTSASTTVDMKLSKFVTSVTVSDDMALHGKEGLSQLTKAFSQTTTPEPASLSLLGVGLTALGLIGMRRRKRR